MSVSVRPFYSGSGFLLSSSNSSLLPAITSTTGSGFYIGTLSSLDTVRLQISTSTTVFNADQNKLNVLKPVVISTSSSSPINNAVFQVSSNTALTFDSIPTTSLIAGNGNLIAGRFLRPGVFDSDSAATSGQSPTAGAIYYNSSSSKLRLYTGSSWIDITTGSGWMPDPDKIVFINDTDTGFFRSTSTGVTSIDTKIDNNVVEKLSFQSVPALSAVTKIIGSNSIAGRLTIIAPGTTSTDIAFNRSSTNTLGSFGIYSDNELAFKKYVYLYAPFNAYMPFDVFKTKTYAHPDHPNSKVQFYFHIIASKVNAHPGDPENGQIYYNTTDNKFYFYENDTWKTLGIATISGTANRLACFDNSGILTASSWTHTSANSGSDFAIRYHTGSTSLSYLGVFSIGNTGDDISTIRGNFANSSIRATGITNGFVFASHGVHLLASNDYDPANNRGIGFLNPINQYAARILADHTNNNLRIFVSNTSTYAFTVNPSGINVGPNSFSSGVIPTHTPNIQSRQSSSYSSLLLQVASSSSHLPAIVFARSKNTLTQMTSISNSDTIGEIYFYAVRPGVSSANNASTFTNDDLCFQITCAALQTMSSYNPTRVLPVLSFSSNTWYNNTTSSLVPHLYILPVYLYDLSGLSYTTGAVYIYRGYLSCNILHIKGFTQSFSVYGYPNNSLPSSNVADGMIIYMESDNKFYFREGGIWKTLSSSGGGGSSWPDGSKSAPGAHFTNTPTTTGLYRNLSSSIVMGIAANIDSGARDLLAWQASTVSGPTFSNIMLLTMYTDDSISNRLSIGSKIGSGSNDRGYVNIGRRLYGTDATNDAIVIDIITPQYKFGQLRFLRGSSRDSYSQQVGSIELDSSPSPDGLIVTSGWNQVCRFRNNITEFAAVPIKLPSLPGSSSTEIGTMYYNTLDGFIWVFTSAGWRKFVLTT